MSFYLSLLARWSGWHGTVYVQRSGQLSTARLPPSTCSGADLPWSDLKSLHEEHWWCLERRSAAGQGSHWGWALMYSTTPLPALSASCPRHLWTLMTALVSDSLMVSSLHHSLSPKPLHLTEALTLLPLGTLPLEA